MSVTSVLVFFVTLMSGINYLCLCSTVELPSIHNKNYQEYINGLIGKMLNEEQFDKTLNNYNIYTKTIENNDFFKTIDSELSNFKDKITTLQRLISIPECGASLENHIQKFYYSREKLLKESNEVLTPDTPIKLLKKSSEDLVKEIFEHFNENFNENLVKDFNENFKEEFFEELYEELFKKLFENFNGELKKELKEELKEELLKVLSPQSYEKFYEKLKKKVKKESNEESNEVLTPESYEKIFKQLFENIKELFKLLTPELYKKLLEKSYEELREILTPESYKKLLEKSYEVLTPELREILTPELYKKLLEKLLKKSSEAKCKIHRFLTPVDRSSSEILTPVDRFDRSQYEKSSEESYKYLLNILTPEIFELLLKKSSEVLTPVLLKKLFKQLLKKSSEELLKKSSEEFLNILPDESSREIRKILTELRYLDSVYNKGRIENILQNTILNKNEATTDSLRPTWFDLLKRPDPMLGESYISYVIRMINKKKMPLPMNLITTIYEDNNLQLFENFDIWPESDAVFVMYYLFQCPYDQLKLSSNQEGSDGKLQTTPLQSESQELSTSISHSENETINNING